MSKKGQRRPRDERDQVAAERIDILFAEARRRATGEGDHHELARRHVEIARKIAMKTRKPLATIYNRQICRKCNTLLVPGHDTRVRTAGRKHNAHVSVTCLQCGAVKRFHYKRDRQPPRDERQ